MAEPPSSLYPWTITWNRACPLALTCYMREKQNSYLSCSVLVPPWRNSLNYAFTNDRREQRYTLSSLFFILLPGARLCCAPSWTMLEKGGALGMAEQKGRRSLGSRMILWSRITIILWVICISISAWERSKLPSHLSHAFLRCLFHTAKAISS